MTARHLAEDRTVGDATRRLLEGLARVHRWIVAIDPQGRVLWTSDVVPELGGLCDLARAPDGGRLPVDLESIRVQDPEGEVTVVIARTRARSELADTDLDARLLDALPQPVLAVDAEGFVQRANAAAARLLSVDADRLLGRPISVLLLERAGNAAELADVLARPEGSPRGELRLRGPEGGWRRLAAEVAPLDGGARALFLSDVTDELGERGRRQTHEEIEHCVNALAHDLRSPLVALLGFSRLLRQDYGTSLDDTGKHYIDRVEQAARTMESLIHDLHELPRIGEPVGPPSLVDPGKVLLQISAEFKPRLDEAGIRLVLPDSSTPLVHCDYLRLYQIFSNLIGNAIEHMGVCEDPRVEVRVEECESTHEIIVSDNGRGVSPEHCERIFEIFQSLDTRSGGRRGTGMGLAIVKKIAENHGGRVWLESEPGRGARFHVSLPRR